MSAANEHERAVAQRRRVEQQMGSRWNDVVSEAISRDVLDVVEREERLYNQRLRDIERINNQALTRLEVIRTQSNP